MVVQYSSHTTLYVFYAIWTYVCHPHMGTSRETIIHNVQLHLVLINTSHVSREFLLFFYHFENVVAMFLFNYRFLLFSLYLEESESICSFFEPNLVMVNLSLAIPPLTSSLKSSSQTIFMRGVVQV